MESEASRISTEEVELGLFGKYRLLDSIATSRRASVYRAKLETVASSKLLALKCVATRLGNDERLAGRFVRAAARASLLKHSAACRVYEVGRTSGALFVAMEYVAGKDLGCVLARARERGETVPREIAAWIASQIAAVLGAAQALGDKDDPSYHGDLEPSHVLIGYDGSVKLCGLGSSVTRAGTPVLRGRRAYQSPEIAAGGAADVRADVFSLGVCLQEMLTGQVISDHAEQTGVRLRKHGLTLLQGGDAQQGEPWTAERIAQRALAENPEARWQRASDLRLALEEFLAGAPQVSERQIQQWMLRLFRGEVARELKQLEQLAAYEPEPREVQPRAPSSGAPILPPPSASSSAPPTQSMRVPRVPFEATAAARSDPDKTPPRGYVVQRLAEKMMAPPPQPPPLPVPPPVPEPAWARDGQVYAFVPEPIADQLEPPPRRWRMELPVPNKVMAIAAAATLLLGAGALALWRGGGHGEGSLAAATAAPATAAPAQRPAPTAAPVRAGASAAPAQLPDAQPERYTLVTAPAPSAIAKSHAARSVRRAPEPTAERQASPSAQPASVQRAARTLERADERAAAAAASEQGQLRPQPAAHAQGAEQQASRALAVPAASSAPVRPASTGIDREPLPLLRAKPEFPKRARRMGIDHGRVTVALNIDRSGAVQSASVVDADPKSVFDEAVLKTVRAWTYKPRLRAGVPVEARGVRVTIQFMEEDQ